MGRRRKGELPRYRLHRQSGQGVVSLPLGGGKYRDVLLGPFDSAASRQEYARVVTEWQAHGAHAPVCRSARPADLSIAELILEYWPTVQEYYRHPDGTPTQEVANIRVALRRLRQLYGDTDATGFDSLALDALRQSMIREGLCRNRINKDAARIKRLFCWAASKKILPASTYHDLLTVKGLRAGRSPARETAPVRPVADQLVEATLPFLLPPVAALVQVQRCTGMRPGEAVRVRPCDLDTSGDVWVYRPGSDQGPHGRHKTAYRGQDRIIVIGPRGQAVLRPFLAGRESNAYCFSPAEARAAYDAERRQNRTTPMTPSQQKRTLKARPKRKPGQRYTVSSYAQAITYGCVKAHVVACPPCRRRVDETRADWQARVARCPGLEAHCWHPNRLRHTAATEIRRAAGIDTARAVLGHRSPTITEVYAEVDVAKASEIMRRIG